MESLTDIKLSAQFEKVHSGKVRDAYLYDGKRILITTDRQSAFDIMVGAVPLKGQVLNQLSYWWFEKTADIVPNHVIALPDPNVMVVKNAKIFPVEVVVRGYITGTTDTSAWVNYNNGVRNFCGNLLPEGLKKNQKFASPLITPTTKSEDHDLLISAEEIIAQGLVPADKWQKITEYAMALYNRGVELARQRGLIFVDTKYEFGEDSEGNLIVCDEVNTPDSSRYWLLDSYAERHARGEEPESLDKEFLRLYLKQNGFNADNIEEVPKSIFDELSNKYIALYEKVTGDSFDYPPEDEKILERMNKNLETFFS